MRGVQIRMCQDGQGSFHLSLSPFPRRAVLSLSKGVRLLTWKYLSHAVHVLPQREPPPLWTTRGKHGQRARHQRMKTV